MPSHSIQNLRFRSGLLPLLILALAACTEEVSPVTGEEQRYGYSWEQEIDIGRQSDRQIVQQLGLYDDPELQAYVERIGQRVLAASDLRDADAPAQYRETPFTFRILDSPVVNAFALPGGYIYVTRGLLAHLNDEAQLAVVLAHEIAHVAARHASRRALKAQWGQLGLIAGAILGAELLDKPELAQDILELGGQAFQLLLLKYSRDDEREADALGVRYAEAAGYAARQGVDFFRTLERIGEQQGRMLPSWQSTHPDPAERAERLAELAGAAGTVDQAGYYRVLAGLVVGDDPRGGYLEDGVFYHPELRFRFPVPRGFELTNEASRVVLSAQGQAVAILELVDAPGARQAAQGFAAEGLRVQGSGETRVNGLPAYALNFQAPSQQGTLGGLALFIEHGGQVYRFMGLAPAQVFPRVAEALERVLRGFEPMDDPRHLAARPARLEIAAAPRRARFADLLPRRLGPGLDERDLAIMNQLWPDSVVEPGSRLKLPR